MPWCLGTSGSVRAMSIPRSAFWPLDVHTFWPLTIHSSPSWTARVCRPARSEPADGSLNSWHHDCRAGDDVAGRTGRSAPGCRGWRWWGRPAAGPAHRGRAGRRSARWPGPPGRRRCGACPCRRRWSAGWGPTSRPVPIRSHHWRTVRSGSQLSSSQVSSSSKMASVDSVVAVSLMVPPRGGVSRGVSRGVSGVRASAVRKLTRVLSQPMGPTGVELRGRRAAPGARCAPPPPRRPDGGPGRRPVPSPR